MGGMMVKIEGLLSTVGTSDFWERVKVKQSSGMYEEMASQLVAQEMISETHAMTRAILMMLGRSTEKMNDAEATLAQR
jgi:hypothetical protein